MKMISGKWLGLAPQPARPFVAPVHCKAAKHLLRATWLWILPLAALLLLAVAQPAWAANPVNLTIQAPTQMNLGDQSVVTAVLKDSKGAPIPGATILFWRPGDFLSVSGAVELGSAKTNAQGIATFNYQARNQSIVTLNVSFSGNDQHDPANTSQDIKVLGSTQLYQSTAGVHLPGVTVWLLVGALTVAWSIYMGMMVLVTLIAPAGEPAPGELGETHA